jgi:hypothetical protein
MSFPRNAPRWLAAALLPLLAACSDRTLTAPLVPTLPPSTVAALDCRVDVAARTLACAPVALPTSARGDKLLGGQEKYVKLSSSGTAYDGGTEILSSNVTVQNLLRQSMGTPDGSTLAGVDVFFAAGPTVTSGTGSVAVGNADGTGTFLAANQPYFHYAEILTPYQISNARSWQFQITGSVSTFTFTVYISTPLVDESGSLLDKVWTGAVSTDWNVGGNWSGGVVPDSASTVSIPADSLLAPGHFLPVLTANAVVSNLRVGYNSTLGLAGFTLTAWGNVDGVGTISGGTLASRGSSSLLGGNLSATVVMGSSTLQRSTKTSEAVSITGTLSVKDQALNISIP